MDERNIAVGVAKRQLFVVTALEASTPGMLSRVRELRDEVERMLAHDMSNVLLLRCAVASQVRGLVRPRCPSYSSALPSTANAISRSESTCDVGEWLGEMTSSVITDVPKFAWRDRVAMRWSPPC